MATKRRGVGKDGVRGAVQNARPPGPFFNDALADSRFAMTDGGLVLRSEDKRPSLICGHFEVCCETRTEDSAPIWGVMIEFWDRDNQPQWEILTRDLFAGEGAELRRLAGAARPLCEPGAPRGRGAV